MVRPMPNHVGEISFSPIPLAIGLFVSVTLLVGLCAKHARKYSSQTSEPNTPNKSPLPSAKRLITTISHKAMVPLIHAKKSIQGSDKGVFGNKKLGQEESGLWQKGILMGEKCQPLEFSGVIYYDYAGNRIPEMPKSPRVSQMSPLRNFTFPHVEKIDQSMY